MSERQKIAILVAALCLSALLLVWSRFTFMNSGDGVVYRGDRLTGEVIRIVGKSSWRVKSPEETLAAEEIRRKKEEQDQQVRNAARVRDAIRNSEIANALERIQERERAKGKKVLDWWPDPEQLAEAEREVDQKHGKQ